MVPDRYVHGEIRSSAVAGNGMAYLHHAFCISLYGFMMPGIFLTANINFQILKPMLSKLATPPITL